MRSILLGAVAALGLCPVIASAAVVINVESKTVDTSGATGDTTVPVEVFGVNADGGDERLNAYTIALDGASFAAGGIRFTVPGASFGTGGRPTVNPFVFKDMETIPPIENFGSTPQRLQFGSTAIGQEDEVNVDPTHNGFIKLSVIVPKSTPAGVYSLTVDPRALSLAGLGAPIVATPGAPGTITVVPEPASMGLIALGGVLFLRRRRIA
jgi:hypothetical protein